MCEDRVPMSRRAGDPRTTSCWLHGSSFPIYITCWYNGFQAFSTSDPWLFSVICFLAMLPWSRQPAAVETMRGEENMIRITRYMIQTWFHIFCVWFIFVLLSSVTSRGLLREINDPRFSSGNPDSLASNSYSFLRHSFTLRHTGCKLQMTIWNNSTPLHPFQLSFVVRLC